MLFSALLALLPLAAAAPVERDLAKRQSFSGRATFYDVGLGACGGYNVASDFIVALNSPQYGGGYPGPNCGRQLSISYGGKTATATVRDQCPGCGYGDLDMSRGLFNYFASEDVGVFHMSWSWSDGSGGGNQPAPEPTTTKAPEPSTTPSPTPTPTPTSTYTPPPTTASPSPTTTAVVQVQVQASPSSTTAAASSSSSAPASASASDSASGSASGSSSVSGSVSGSASASASASAAPGNSKVLASDDGNLAAIAGAVVALGKLIITGNTENTSA